ncbi:hypothetical protein ACA910_004885 [Epithemia clementina (nom. ined.)]
MANRRMAALAVAFCILCTGSTFQIRPLRRVSNTWSKHIDLQTSLIHKTQSHTIFVSSSRISVDADIRTEPRRQNNRNNNNNNRGNNNNNFNNNNNNGQRRQNFNNRDGSRAPGGGGWGSSPVLKLVNPMKVERVVSQVAQTDEERQQDQEEQREQQQQQRQQPDRQQRTGDRRPARRNIASISADQNGTSSASVDGDDVGDDGTIIRKDVGRKRIAKPTKRVMADKSDEDRPRKPRPTPKDDGDGRNARRPSLRLGTGKGGRGAELNQRRGSLRKRDRTAEKEAKIEAALERKTVVLPEGPISVSELANLIDEKPIAVIKYLMTDLGVMASMTQNLDPATCIAVVEGFGKVIGGNELYDEEMMELLVEESALATGFVEEEDDPDSLKPRAPVVTIMGHVDHGKTSLLDAIRNTKVTDGEAGGITQHIAAYQVQHNDHTITFIDTPGHAAFTDMRERGANITDIVILVVAADDGVKQQTIDSISCARQAGVPIVVAINKCDLDTADPLKVMTELTAYDILTEEFGGEVLSSQISAKTGSNLDDLLDKVMMQAELQDLKANPNRAAEGIVVEANVERGLGTVATTLIKKGTIRVGDVFVAGETYGKVRALVSTADGKTRFEEATPSMPVRIVGFEGIPNAGDMLTFAETEQLARELAESRQRIARERESSIYQADLMSSVARTFGSNKKRREMCVLVKADVQGSAEALTRALRELKLEDEEAVVTVKVLVSEAGEVSKSDIAIASVTPDTTVLAFNVAASFAAMEDARVSGVKIEYHNIVYDAIESIESRMQEILSPTPEGEYVGSALVQEVFNIGGTGNIAGSRCQDGIVKKGANVRVMRGDKILTETRVKTLRNFKAETDTIEAGNDCGIGLFDFEDFAVGDVIECYVPT